MRRYIVRLSLRWKIALAILFTFVIILPSVSLTLFYFTDLLERLTILIDQDVKLGRMANDLSLTMLDIRRYERNYRMFGSQAERESIESLIAHADSIITEAGKSSQPTSAPLIDQLADHLDIYANSFMMLVEHISQNPPETGVEQKAKIARRLNDFQKTYRDILDRLDNADPADRDSILVSANRDLDIFSFDLLAMSDRDVQPEYIRENLDQSREAFLHTADELAGHSWENMQLHRLASLRAEARAKRNIISVLMLTGLICLLTALYLPRYIVRPITHLIRVFKKVEEGDLSASAATLTNDEVGDLARSFNRMIENVRVFDDLKTQKIASQKRAFDRFIENLDKPACILTRELNAIFYNAAFTALFSGDIPPRPPETGLDLKQIESMADFASVIRKKLSETANNFIVEFHAGDRLIRMKGRGVRNPLMKLESVVLIGDIQENQNPVPGNDAPEKATTKH